MAKAEYRINGDFDRIVKEVEDGIIGGSVSATLEEKSDYIVGGSRCSVRAFERFSYTGGNRVSLTVTFFQPDGGVVYITAMTTGGSQGVFKLFDTFGEGAFLDKFRKIIEAISE